jgi:hypothetical protein
MGRAIQPAKRLMNDTPDILLFLGRFHPLLVHLPIGFLVLLVALESLACFRRFRSANACAGYVLAFLVPAALSSATCGWLLSGSGVYDGHILQVHRWLGILTVLLCAWVALCHSRQWKQAYTIGLCASALVLALASHFGGSLTHGNDYLTHYAPNPIKALLDRQSATAHVETVDREKGVFPAVVHPILQAHCATCHNQKKHHGGLRLDTLEWLLQGGDNGPVVVAGKAADSPMYQRLLLPLESEDHMPPSGKPQLQPEEITVLRWWINVGAPFETAVNELHPPADVRRALELLCP